MKLEVQYKYRISRDNDLDGIPFEECSMVIATNNEWYRKTPKATVTNVVDRMIFSMIDNLYHFRTIQIVVLETKLID